VNKVLLTIEQHRRSSLAFRDYKSKAFELEFLPRQSSIAEIALSLTTNLNDKAVQGRCGSRKTMCSQGREEAGATRGPRKLIVTKSQIYSLCDLKVSSYKEQAIGHSLVEMLPTCDRSTDDAAALLQQPT
jgi:hypothetical protein